MGQNSALEELLSTQIRFIKLTQPVREYRFAAAHVGPGPGVRLRLLEHYLRDWRFDFAWVDLKFAVEVEGVTAQGGRHQRMAGFKDDIEKYHAALAMGWIVYRTSGALIHNGQALTLIENQIRGGLRGL